MPYRGVVITSHLAVVIDSSGPVVEGRSGSQVLPGSVIPNNRMINKIGPVAVLNAHHQAGIVDTIGPIIIATAKIIWRIAKLKKARMLVSKRTGCQSVDIDSFGLAIAIGVELSQGARRRVPEESSGISHLVNIGIANNITTVVDPVSTPIGTSKEPMSLGT